MGCLALMTGEEKSCRSAVPGCRQFTAEQGQLPAPSRGKNTPRGRSRKGTGMRVPGLPRGLGGRLGGHSLRVTAWTVALRSIPGDVQQVVLSPVDRKEKTPRNHSLTISQHEKKLPVLLSLLGVPHQGLVWAAGGTGGVANPQHRAWTYGIVPACPT